MSKSSQENDPKSLKYLKKVIRENKLNLVISDITPSDGSCWYWSILDQLKLHNITSFPRIGRYKNDDFPKTAHALRLYICKFLPRLPQAKDWRKNLFANAKEFDAFIEKHKQENEWTDERGIMCNATALIIGRQINIIGTVDYS